ncbi:hypothetical protein GALMADRAFT_78235 [Galerina marginata CBS 339.88]|uniref:F-box domain-containing protein n=1 Tax=Galerina marginata (strain CBS 339.88) TaxID=685588 RepID=A0A067SCW4_GALM3|nr:hypothetical protein GALMADRAFT_78235 [Galerina marginata CBS 339.88]
MISSRIHIFRKLVVTLKNVSFVVSSADYFLFTISPFVKRLEFRNLNFYSGWASATNLFPHFLPTLTHLHLCDITFNTFLDVTHTICAFPHLQSVEVVRVHWDSNAIHARKGDAVQYPVLPPFVHRIRWRDTPLHELLHWLLSHDKLPIVPHLDIGPVRERDVSSAGRYLFQVGPHLRHITFSFCFGTYHDCALLSDPERRGDSLALRYKEVFGISTCHHIALFTELRSLKIDDFVDCNSLSCNQRTPAFCAPRVLASVRSPKLTRLILGINLAKVGALDKHDVNWEFLDETFASRPYETLEVIEFEVKGRVNVEGLKELISSRLPYAAGRGLLKFHKAT